MPVYEVEVANLREKIIRSLIAQGFSIEGNRLVMSRPLNKKTMREIHLKAVEANREKARKVLEKDEKKLLSFFAHIDEIQPELIRPKLIPVEKDNIYARLFRYATLHWSLPVSSGYGRRLRFLVIDESNSKLIGLFGLCDPVLQLKPRDQWIGWQTKQIYRRLKHVMDAYVVGAVPPYSYLLFGKFIASILISWEVRECFKKKYAGRRTTINNELFNGQLALITTMSAFGRSSIYNRLTYKNRKIAISVGFTQGYGEFHFSNGIYHDIFQFAQKYLQTSAKNHRWGNGWRNKREVVRKVLKTLGLPLKFQIHGIKREIYVFPLARNSRQFLQGFDDNLEYFDVTMNQLFMWFKKRWLMPRIDRLNRHQNFNPEQLKLWG